MPGANCPTAKFRNAVAWTIHRTCVHCFVDTKGVDIHDLILIHVESCGVGALVYDVIL